MVWYGMLNTRYGRVKYVKYQVEAVSLKALRGKNKKYHRNNNTKLALVSCYELYFRTATHPFSEEKKKKQILF